MSLMLFKRKNNIRAVDVDDYVDPSTMVQAFNDAVSLGRKELFDKVRDAFDIPEGMNLYNHLGGKELKHCLVVGITNDGDTKRVTFYARLYKDKVVSVPFSFSSTFSDAQILKDPYLVRFYSRRYLK